MKITKTRLVKLVKEELDAVLQEKEDDWISGAVDPENEGGLHRDLGIPEDEKIPTGLLRKKKRELRKAAEGDKTLSKKDKQLLDRVQFALNVRGLKKEGCGDISEEGIVVPVGSDGTETVINTAREDEEALDTFKSMYGEGIGDDMDDAALAALADMLLPKLMKLLGKDEEAAEDDEG
jgi:hypothetical protein